MATQSSRQLGKGPGEREIFMHPIWTRRRPSTAPSGHLWPSSFTANLQIVIIINRGGWGQWGNPSLGGIRLHAPLKRKWQEESLADIRRPQWSVYKLNLLRFYLKLWMNWDVQVAFINFMVVKCLYILYTHKKSLVTIQKCTLLLTMVLYVYVFDLHTI